MLTAPYYLAVGDCILEDGSGTLDYRVSSMQFPAPEIDANGEYPDAERKIGRASCRER